MERGRWGEVVDGFQRFTWLVWVFGCMLWIVGLASKKRLYFSVSKGQRVPFEWVVDMQVAMSNVDLKCFDNAVLEFADMHLFDQRR